MAETRCWVVAVERRRPLSLSGYSRRHSGTADKALAREMTLPPRGNVSASRDGKRVADQPEYFFRRTQ